MKKELIKRIKNLPVKEGPIADTITVNREWLLNSLEQLEEPNIPVVQQFVADWYEEHKDNLELNLYRAIDLVPSNYRDGELSKFEEWLVDEHTTPFQTLVNMHQFGYDIKEEKKYLVRMIGLDKDESYLKYNMKFNFWYLGTSETYKYTRVKHTIEELEKSGFKEVFPSPLFEIKEVKE